MLYRVNIDWEPKIFLSTENNTEEILRKRRGSYWRYCTPIFAVQCQKLPGVVQDIHLFKVDDDFSRKFKHDQDDICYVGGKPD